MKMYCMCEITGSIPSHSRDSQGFGPLDKQVYLAPNRFGPISDDWLDIPDSRPVFLQTSMELIISDMQQRIPNSGPIPPNQWHRTKAGADKDFKTLLDSHRCLPHVDLYECPRCRAKVVVGRKAKDGSKSGIS